MTQYLYGAKRAALVKKVCDLYHDGLTIRQVASEIGYSYCATRNMLVRAGVRLRPKGVRALTPAAAGRVAGDGTDEVRPVAA